MFLNLDFKNMDYQPTSYVFSVKNFKSTDLEKARVAAKSFMKLN